MKEPGPGTGKTQVNPLSRVVGVPRAAVASVGLELSFNPLPPLLSRTSCAAPAARATGSSNDTVSDVTRDRWAEPSLTAIDVATGAGGATVVTDSEYGAFPPRTRADMSFGSTLPLATWLTTTAYFPAAGNTCVTYASPFCVAPSSGARPLSFDASGAEVRIVAKNIG